MYQDIVDFIKALFPDQNPVPLHAPVFLGNERDYLIDCIDSTYVSYVGKYVSKFEEVTAEYTGAKFAIAVVNGTAALQIALQIAGVKAGDEVITQPLTFVATANAISHCGAKPVFIDVDRDTMGMSPEKLNEWLLNNIKYDRSTRKFLNKTTHHSVTAIVPMHTFGIPCRIDEIVEIGNRYNIPVIEDAAEALGSFYKKKHTGTFGKAGILSYNGNKIITTGGGGMIITDDENFAKRAKHITTTAKVQHKWEYVHDEVGYNYRMTNVSAAIGVGQMENLTRIIDNKRKTAEKYSRFFSNNSLNPSIFSIQFIREPENSDSNYWLNCIRLENREKRDEFLEETNAKAIMTRPIWRLLNKLKMFNNCQADNIENSEWLESRIVNLPSSYRD